MAHDGIIGRNPDNIYSGDNNFTALLSDADLRRLRLVVKNEHMKHYDSQFVTDAHADMLINAISPEIAEQMVRTAVDAGDVD